MNREDKYYIDLGKLGCSEENESLSIHESYEDIEITEEDLEDYLANDKYSKKLNKPNSSGPMVLLRNGNIYDISSYETHPAFAGAVGGYFGYEYDEDEFEDYDSDFLDYLEEELGVITLNPGDHAFEDRLKIVCESKPTSYQLNAIRDFIDVMQTRFPSNTTLYLWVMNHSQTYELGMYTSDELIKKIRMVFVRGRLEEKHYATPDKLYSIENDEATWPEDAEDYVYWHSEADKWAEDYAKSYKVKMSPKDFLDLTTTNGADSLNVGDSLGLGKLRDLDIDEFNKEQHQNIFLQIAFRNANNPNVAQVVGHEGRHRMFALMQAGVKSVDVELIADVYDTEYNKYKPFKLDRITLIGQFNKNAVVTVYNPIPMSWKQHKSIRPNLRDESLTEYLDEIKDSNENTIYHDYPVYVTDEVYRLKSMLQRADKPYRIYNLDETYYFQDATGNMTHGEMLQYAKDKGYIAGDTRISSEDSDYVFPEDEDIGYIVFIPKNFSGNIRYHTRLGDDGYHACKVYSFGNVYVRDSEEFDDDLFKALGESERTIWYDELEGKVSITDKNNYTREFDILDDLEGNVDNADTVNLITKELVKEDFSKLARNCLDALDKEFGQEEVYMWSTYILPNGHFLNPDNSKWWDEINEDPQYEHCDFEDWAWSHGYKGQLQEIYNNCVKMNVTDPYLGMPDKAKPTQEQMRAVRKILNNQDALMFEYHEWDQMADSQEDIDRMGPRVLGVFTPVGDKAFDLDVSSADDIIKEINKAYVRGGFNEELSRDEIEDRVANELGTSKEPIEGPSYILRDGSFLKIWNSDVDIKGLSGSKSVSGKTMHLDVDGFINKEIDADSYSYYYLNHDCIRVNTGFEEYIVLPKERPNNAQFDSLLKWLNFYFFDKGHDKLKVMDWYGSSLNTKEYYLDETMPEEIIKKIKSYYATGELKENKGRFRVEWTTPEDSFEKSFSTYQKALDYYTDIRDGDVFWSTIEMYDVSKTPAELLAIDYKSNADIDTYLNNENLQEKIVKKGSKWQVQSEKGRNLGTYDTKKEAEKRLKQVHYFKNLDESLVSKEPPVGPCFIAIDGSFISGEKYHGSLIAKDDTLSYLSSLTSSKDTSDFVDRTGFIRCNDGAVIDFEKYIELPKKEITKEQYDSLELYLYHLSNNGWCMIEFANTSKQIKVDFKYDDVQSIIKKVEQYYKSKTESKQVHYFKHMNEDKEDYQKKFDERTHAHIDRVNKYAKKINKEYPHHDEDKFNELYDGYSLMSKNKEDITKEEQAMIDDATFKHVINNEHHCEHWVDSKDIEGFSRDNPTPNGCLDCSKMPNDALEEMCCDWCAMSEEFNNTPFEWYEKNKDTRWHFNEEQDKFILNTLHRLWNESLDESIHLIDKENKNCYYTRSAYDVRNFIDDRLVHGAMSVIKICYFFESDIYLFADGYDCIHEMLEEMAVEQGLVEEDELSERYLVYSKDNDDLEVIDYSEGKVFAYKNFKVFDASHNQTFKETELYNILSWPVKEFKMMNGMFIKDGKAVTSLKNESLNESDDTLYYHGSSQKGLNKLTSPINWITDDKEYAKYYALALSDTAYVYICEADLDNIFDAGRTGDNAFALMPITKPYKLSVEMKRLADRLNLSEEDAYKLVQDAISEYPQNNEYRTKISTVVRSNAFKKILQEKGYTSIHTIEYNVPYGRYCDCYGILDSNDVKILSSEEVTRDAKLNDK